MAYDGTLRAIFVLKAYFFIFSSKLDTVLEEHYM